jgi:hypothetical protein
MRWRSEDQRWRREKIPERNCWQKAEEWSIVTCELQDETNRTSIEWPGYGPYSV